MSQIQTARKRAKNAVRRARFPKQYAVSKQVRSDGMTLLPIEAIWDLQRRMRMLEKAAVPGSVMETGTALGGSAIALAAAKTPRRPMFVFDVFGMIPPPTDRDGADVHERYDKIVSGDAEGRDGETYYGYRNDLVTEVTNNFASCGQDVHANSVTLLKGLFEDTVRPDGPVALAHIDGDWYESVKVCLDRIWPHLSPGGVMVIDDYDAWSGCRTAVDEFLEATPDARTEQWSRLHILR